MSYKILAINPGSTSTKIGVYQDENVIFTKTIRHSTEELSVYSSVFEQFEFRKKSILDTLEEQNINISALSAVVGRGGLLKPIEGGTYRVNEDMLRDLKSGIYGEHASNLGAVIAQEIAETAGVSAFIVDPVVVDEMDEVARISGIPQVQRKSIFHALNQKAAAKRYAQDIGKNYEDINVIVVHLGGGISVGAHQNGRVVDVNNALDGEGPFSPERAGSLPVGDIIKMCFSGQYTQEQMKKLITGKGGMVAHLGTNDTQEIIKRTENEDNKAKLIIDSMCYQVAKEIGKCAAVLSGKVDAVILTGGIAYSQYVTEYISEKVSFISKVVVYPGEDELLALVQGTLRILNGTENEKAYK